MIIITGITGGIGNFLFQQFSSAGEQVAGTYHLTKPEGKLFENTHPLDITNFKDAERFISSLNANQVTLVNCAGVSANAFAHKSDPGEWSNIIHVNLPG